MKKIIFVFLIIAVMQLSSFVFGATKNSVSNPSRTPIYINSEPPKVTTDSVSSITPYSAICGGTITSRGDENAEWVKGGVCWGTGINPKIINNNYSKTLDAHWVKHYTSKLTGLSPNTTYYVRAYATNHAGTSYGLNVSFTTPGLSQISLNRSSLNFGGVASSSNPNPQFVSIRNSGDGILDWKVASSANWLSVTPSSGTGDSILSISVNPTGLAEGNYTGTITVSDENASNSPQTITVKLNVYNQGKTSAPFGEFATPTDGSTVRSSIPITGWALDDIGIANVKIYNGSSYIGDAVFVDGSRPDVETAFPNYPNNHKAGWGYMLLTNTLPDRGNGTYVLVAKATDTEGHEVTLGSKTITVDNAHATKPFGAIDTPTQGGTVLGKNVINSGWVLTPQPSTIPIDGSTIKVVIDGVTQDHAGYNQLRTDIASLFPGYNNTNGAGGYFYIDTTKLKNGLHTIAWNVTDNNGNTDEIGSRYFSVMNTGTGTDSSVSSVANDSSMIQAGISMNGYDVKNIEIKELERLEIHFADQPNAPIHNVKGYLVVEDQLKECPIGSTLDKDKGIFYWQPGPGFVGEYRFIFTGEDENGQNIQKNIIVNIKPKF